MFCMTYGRAVAKQAEHHKCYGLPAFMYVLKMEAVCISETVVASYLSGARCCRCARAGCMLTGTDRTGAAGTALN